MRNSSVSIPCNQVPNQEESRQANLIRTTSMLGSDIHRGWKSSLSRDSSVRRDDDRFSVQYNGLEKLFLSPSGSFATWLKLRTGSPALSDTGTSALSLSINRPFPSSRQVSGTDVTTIGSSLRSESSEASGSRGLVMGALPGF